MSAGKVRTRETVRRFVAVRSLKMRLLLMVSAAIMSCCAGTVDATMRQLYPDREGLYGVQSVSRLSRLSGAEKDNKHKPCDAQLGDEIEVYVKNLGLWLRDIEKSKRIDAGAGKEDLEKDLPFKEQEINALVGKSLPKLCLVIDGHPLRTVGVDSYYSDPPWTVIEYPLINKGGLRLQDMTTVEIEAWKTESADEKKTKVAEGDITPTSYGTVGFRLIRDGGDSQSRADWFQLLHMSQEAKQKNLTIGFVDKNDVILMPTWVLRSANKEASGIERQFSFDRLPLSDPWVITGGIALLLAAAAFGWLARATTLLRDGNGPQSPFSLGRCQMAFWFFLVAWAFLFLWLVTGRGDTDTLTPETLVLMGISAVTGLGAAFIGSRGVAARRSSKGFLVDLVTESDVQGVSFHRFQIIMWTLVMGIIFVSEVLTRLAMPKFDTTLLALMGISSGTYLGFKFTDAGGGATAASPQPAAPAPAGESSVPSKVV